MSPYFSYVKSWCVVLSEKFYDKICFHRSVFGHVCDSKVYIYIEVFVRFN